MNTEIRAILRGHGLTELRSIDLRNLNVLDLRDNALTDVEELKASYALTSLYLGSNLLKSLTPLSNMRRLQTLDLSNNKLTAVHLGGLISLQVLNLAGNSIKEPQHLTGLGECTRLLALDLARNCIGAEDELLELLRDIPITLLSFIGNPCGCNRPPSELTRLAVFNGRVVAGKEGEAASLRRLIHPDAGLFWAEGSAQANGRPPSEQPVAGGSGSNAATIAHADSASSIPPAAPDCRQSGLLPPHRAVAGQTPRDTPREASTLTRDSAEEGVGALHSGIRRPIMDSADDMTSGGRTPPSSVSEFGAAYNTGSASGGAPPATLMGLVERQDSANYQPRPPALAERQDSAQNLQALAEAEAELTGGTAAEPCTLARQDSAHELDDIRSPSPISREQLSLSGRLSSLSGELAARSPVIVSPRQDSASERQGSLRLAAEDRFPGSPGWRISSQSDPHEASDARLSRGHSMESLPGSLEAARLLHQTASQSLDHSAQVPARGPREGADPFSVVHRQDSALDSLAEARRAVMSELPRGTSTPIPTSDPLQQARQLVQSVSLNIPRSPTHSRLGSWRTATDLDREGGRSPVYVSRRPACGPESPFERPITPLSPTWTASHLQPSFSQHLPRIASGVPWTGSTSQEHLTGESLFTRPAGVDSQGKDEGSLLAEARRLILGQAEEACKGGPPQAPTPQRNTDVGPSTGQERHQGGHGESARETPYPDSPLAAGADGSLRDPTFFHRQASMRAACADVAESSQAASRRVQS